MSVVDDLEAAVEESRTASRLLSRVARSRYFRKWHTGFHRRALMKLLPQLHYEGVHVARRFALNVLENFESGLDVYEQTRQPAIDFANACKRVLGSVLQIDTTEQLHCCLKFFVVGDQDLVGTWARSVPSDGRPVAEDDLFPVTNNTVWCALLGCNDGVTQWMPFHCFCSNDLKKYSPNTFKCSRDHWANYYRSALVYPLRFRPSPVEENHRTVGFLCFDSPMCDAFSGLPDILEDGHRLPDREGGRAVYQTKCSRSPIFHTGAILADTLSMFLRPYYSAIDLDERN